MRGWKECSESSTSVWTNRTRPNFTSALRCSLIEATWRPCSRWRTSIADQVGSCKPSGNCASCSRNRRVTKRREGSLRSLIAMKARPKSLSSSLRSSPNWRRTRP